MGVEHDFFLIAQTAIHSFFLSLYRRGLQRGVTSFALDGREFEEDSVEFALVSHGTVEGSIEFDAFPEEFCESIA